ncbi:MAG: TM0996/MTH895 family glutaredoxin-like protein [Parcubacteria group bacterium]|nr:TM0996/MTH895 family glutaredoxin-like protein [Parcubacteria group bacterium]
MIIKILGSGCPNCEALEKNTKKAIEELSLKDVRVEHVDDINKIMKYGVMSTPAIVFDNEVKAAGRIPSTEEIKSWLKYQ